MDSAAESHVALMSQTVTVMPLGLNRSNVYARPHHASKSLVVSSMIHVLLAAG